jgi:hypothetical protein
MHHSAVKSVHGTQYGQKTLGVGTLAQADISQIGRHKSHVSYDSRDLVNVLRNFSRLFIGTEWCCLALRAPTGESFKATSDA